MQTFVNSKYSLIPPLAIALEISYYSETFNNFSLGMLGKMIPNSFLSLIQCFILFSVSRKEFFCDSSSKG